ncbi:MAG TPA: (Fe-S)-binding protein [Solirubrobacteraceae bacterium]|nr:(Fe-S)-binding protein [Solirubrobacteraceae bacterium]
MSGFDSHRPPSQDIMDDCVHCGFCLDTCPTYVLWQNEADSPRGRIVLMTEAASPGGQLSDEMVTHFDRCLGCMACVSACPSGVRYDRLIERVRPQVKRQHKRSNREQALRLVLFETLPYPKRLRGLALTLPLARRLRLDRLPGRLGAMIRLAPRARVRDALSGHLPERTPAQGRQRGRVALLQGCVQRVFFSGVHQTAVQVLAAEGFEVLAPRLPDCCGALEMHAGEDDAAVARAQATIAAFDAVGQVDYVITSAAGCGSAMKEYGELLDTDAARAFAGRVRDISEVLADVEPVAPRGPVPLRVVYHDACHLAHAQGVRDEPRSLLRSIPALELVEVPTEPEVCCGSAGIYNLVQADAAAELGRRKALHVLDSGAEAVAAGNPGCAAQLDVHLRQLGRPLPIHHPVELLWRSIAGAA